MRPQRIKIAELLLDLECLMRQRTLWSHDPPSSAGYRSQVPFSADCWSLEQWLQFIFIPKMKAILDGDEPLPERCSIAPMVISQGCGVGGDLTCLEPLLKVLDEVISQAP
ncbi:MAG: YqcC family protein [Halieaceae bacterium]|nr:YqcC family protein [Halieaceae bacterium]